MSPRIVTLTTDFGYDDGYAAAMKGVMLSVCPELLPVDITHAVPPHDVRHGAYVLGTAARRFPAGTIHLGVVDPGVGTSRRGMVLMSGGHVYVGPDNGLFTFAIGDGARAVRIEPSAEASATFHGRDLFAPVAAEIASGRDPYTLGPAITDPVRLQDWEKSRSGDTIRGRVLHIDRFGNVISNLCPGDLFHASPQFTIEGRFLPAIPVGRTYGDVEAGEPIWLVGSEGFYELAVREGSAAERFGLRRGDTVIAADGQS